MNKEFKKFYDGLSEKCKTMLRCMGCDDVSKWKEVRMIAGHDHYIILTEKTWINLVF
jgi:hypothetical protein